MLAVGLTNAERLHASGVRATLSSVESDEGREFVTDLGKNRRAILVRGILTMLTFGAIYVWAIFISPLEAEFGWTYSQTSLVFSVAMVGLSLDKLANVRLQARCGADAVLGSPMADGSQAGQSERGFHVVG